MKVSEQVKNYRAIDTAASMILGALRYSGTVYICGNGGSAEQANHFAAELVGRFKINGRRPLPAVSLSSNMATITAIANDFGFEEVYERQVRALVSKQDVVVGISTSGTSQNVIRAVRAARDLGASTIGLTSYDSSISPNHLHIVSDLCLFLGIGTADAQEKHLHAIHRMADIIDRAYAPSPTSEGKIHGNQKSPDQGKEEGHQKEGNAENHGGRHHDEKEESKAKGNEEEGSAAASGTR